MQSDATPQARRRARTAERLRGALAREAGIGRNAIYANHRTILNELRQAPMEPAPKESVMPIAGWSTGA